MNSVRHLTVIILFMIALGSGVSSQSPPQPSTPGKERTGTISGHVTIDNQPVFGARVILVSAEEASISRRTLNAQGTTEQNGMFRIAAVPPGSYTLTVAMPAYILPGDGYRGAAGRLVILKEGEDLGNIDLALKRGGVITGRVTDNNDQPLIAERLSIESIDDNGRKRPFHSFNLSNETDDRGIYRVYGLPEGRYLISLAQPKGLGKTVYYPGVTDESKAARVNVQPGNEVEKIDIKLASPDNTYTVTGRVVETETGSPQPNIECGVANRNNNRSFGLSEDCRSDTNGELRIENLAPGRYTLFAKLEPNTDFYSEGTPFEITNSDLDGLEIKVHRGSSIGGTLELEGAGNSAVLVQNLSRISIYAVRVETPTPLTGPKAQIAPNGSFKITGVQPGRIRLLVSSYPLNNFSLSRVEQNGVVQTNGINVIAGKPATGVRLLLSYGNSNIRGQINAQNGVVPKGARIRVRVVRSNDPLQSIGSAEADSQGRFLIKNVPAGTYEVIVIAQVPAGNGRMINLPSVRQSVNVINDTDSEVIIVLDLPQGI